MKEFIGVLPLQIAKVDDLKRNLLLCGRIAIPGLARFLGGRETLRNKETAHLINELEWLQENKLVFDSSEVPDEGLSYALRHLPFHLIQAQGMDYIEDERSAAEAYLLARINCMVLNKDPYAEAFEILGQISDLFSSSRIATDLFKTYAGKELLKEPPKKKDILNVIVKQIPVPSELTPWEQILDFRNDPDARGSFLGLRFWISDMARSPLSTEEVAEKLEYLLYQYEQYMKIHKMKMRSGTLQTVIVSAAELLENAMKLKLGKLAKELFSVQQRKVDLLEAEIKSPGAELAYIYKAKRAFGSVST
jgi:hypothetical protein